MSSRALRVVVNADDLGMSREVNEATFELIRLGRVTSATILANAPFVEEALAGAGETVGASFGVHLNASQFQPLTEAAALAPLLDEEGCFAGNIRSVALDSPLRAALSKEFLAQVERVRAAGITPSHLDSHHHVHTLPGLLPVLRDLQKKTGIRRVRPTRTHYGASAAPKLSLRAKKKAWNLALKSSGSRMVDLVTDLRSFVEQPAGKPGQWLELMVHPGSPDHREEEALLRTEWWTTLHQPVELLPYSAL